MIHMPHRSVTRFFVPLIDVLLLLFCIFLLMPFANEDELEKTSEQAILEKDNGILLGNELDRINQDMQNLERDKETIKDINYLRQLEAKVKQLSKPPEQQYDFHVIDIERDDGDIYSVNKLGERKHIKDAKDAKELIARDRAEADKEPLSKGKKLYYCFIYPRPTEGYPTPRQINKYKEWFSDVEISFIKGAPK